MFNISAIATALNPKTIEPSLLLPTLPAGLTRVDTPLTQQHVRYENPDDIAPVVDLIWGNICAQSAVCNNTGEIFVTQLGENHPVSSNIAIQTATIKGSSTNNDRTSLWPKLNPSPAKRHPS